jgi:hypothetical protein
MVNTLMKRARMTQAKNYFLRIGYFALIIADQIF